MASISHRRRLSQMFTRKKSLPKLSGLSPDSPRTPFTSSNRNSPATPSPLPTPPVTPANDRKLLRKARRLSQALGDVIMPSPEVKVGEDGQPYAFSHSQSPVRTGFVVSERAKSPSNTPGATPIVWSQDYPPTAHTTPERAKSPSGAAPIIRSQFYPPVAQVAPERAKSPSGATPIIRSQHYPPRHLIVSNSSLSNSDLSPTPIPGVPATPPMSETGHSGTYPSPNASEYGHSVCSSTRPVIETPPEKKLRSSSSRPKTSSDDTNSAARGDFPSMRSNRRRAVKRRLSLDFSTLSQSISAPLNSGAKPTMKRSRSLWNKKAEDVRADDAPDGLLEPSGPLSEKQRTLNVKRAKKMTQLFGSEPPRTLFQVTHSEHGNRSSSSEEPRTSLTTILSISTANLLSLPPRRRTISDASSLIFETSPPITPIFEPEPAEPEQSRSSTPALQNMPFTSLAPIKTPKTPSISHKEFHQRRLRAAKLSKFFGVDVQDLRKFLPDKPPSSRPGTSHNQDTFVEVAIGGPKGKGAFWERAQSPNQEADMQDVIHRLRDLKAS